MQYCTFIRSGDGEGVLGDGEEETPRDIVFGSLDLGELRGSGGEDY